MDTYGLQSRALSSFYLLRGKLCRNERVRGPRRCGHMSFDGSLTIVLERDIYNLRPLVAVDRRCVGRLSPYAGLTRLCLRCIPERCHRVSLFSLSLLSSLPAYTHGESKAQTCESRSLFVLGSTQTRRVRDNLRPILRVAIGRLFDLKICVCASERGLAWPLALRFLQLRRGVRAI